MILLYEFGGFVKLYLRILNCEINVMNDKRYKNIKRNWRKENGKYKNICTTCQEMGIIHCALRIVKEIWRKYILW